MTIIQACKWVYCCRTVCKVCLCVRTRTRWSRQIRSAGSSSITWHRTPSGLDRAWARGKHRPGNKTFLFLTHNTLERSHLTPRHQASFSSFNLRSTVRINSWLNPWRLISDSLTLCLWLQDHFSLLERLFVSQSFHPSCGWYPKTPWKPSERVTQEIVLRFISPSCWV